MASIYKTEGVILGQSEIGEADKLLIVYSRDFGKIKIFAKSVRLLRSKLKGHLNTGAYLRLMFVQGADKLRLIDAQEFELNDYPVFSRSLFFPTFSFLNRIIQGSEKDEAVWFLFLRFLERGPIFENVAAARKIFAARLLHRLGYVDENHYPELREIIKNEKRWNFNIFEKQASVKMDTLIETGIKASHL
ncbi:MAG: recombination protein O N-terminal domain-containing protein [Candidatus Niyogibacteria bacterium]|nr:recombination protein O N-terminal domain-containing protein [Candidatus Niyogibacteria bacterium]